MMALERPTAENQLTRSERPETSSKFSRNSKRSDFHMTCTDFGSSTDSLGKSHPNKKMETQTKFYSTKSKLTKAGSFGSTFYPSERNNTRKRSNDSRDSHMGEILPNIKENDIIDTKASNTDSILPNGEFKQGMTLDKFLGGGFKKIDIFNSNLKEFDKKDSYVDDIIEERTNELSEPDEKEYQYESFEILEADEEDDVSEVNQDSANKHDHKDHHPQEELAFQENHEVLSRIQNKYKSSKPKFIPKEKPKRFRARSPLKEKQEAINNNNNISETEHYEPESRKRNLSSNKAESKSLSPKFGHSKTHGKGFGFSHEASKYAIDIPQNGETISVSSLLKNTNSPSNAAMQTQNSFRATRSKFNVTNENFKGGNEKPRTTLMKKSTYHNKPWIQTNSLDYGDETGYEKQGGRSHSLAGTLKPLENTAKFQNEKMSNVALEQKFMRENKMMTEKIKQSEKEMMDKYAKMFKLNQQEVHKLAKDTDGKKIEGPKRLSTPLKDFSASRNFQKRKIINL